ncbi:MAG: PAS domain S-box protein, partial [Promethearchaeota archaeon]
MEQKEAQKDLKRLEWLLKKQISKVDYIDPSYGDLTKLNTERTILDSVGPKILKELASEFLDLLETSGAVYERNGNYAMGIFSSKWCRFLDTASRNLCNTSSNQKALECGEWHCHESCWLSSKLSMEQNREIDIVCHGGIHLFAIPIKVGDRVIGSINFGYGDPPKDPKTLKKIAENYNVDVEKLKKIANLYENRPKYMIEIAKKRIRSVARTIEYLIERKEAESSLKFEKQFIDKVLNTSKDTIFVFEPNNERAVRWNNSFSYISGYTNQEIATLKAPKSYYNENDLRRAKDAIRMVLDGEETTIELSLITKNGQFIPFEYSLGVFRNDEGTPLIVSVGRNVSKRKTILKKLKSSEKQYRQLVDLANSIVVRLDKDKKIAFINKFGEEFFEYSMEELLNKPVIGTIVPKKELSGRDLEELVKTIFESPENYIQIENENITKSGKRVWVSWANKALKDDKGNFQGLLSTGIDITKRKEAENLIKESERKYREAFNKSNFYKDLIAHDVNNVFQAIQSSVDIYKIFQNLPEKEHSLNETFSTIIKQLNRGTKIVLNIIKLSEIENGKIQTKPMRVIFSLNKLIEQAFKSFDKKDVDISIKAEKMDYYVQANELLYDLIENLIKNAIENNESEKKTI